MSVFVGSCCCLSRILLVLKRGIVLQESSEEPSSYLASFAIQKASVQNAVDPVYNDIGQCDASSITSAVAWYKLIPYCQPWVTRWCSWLRHCATSWKVARSIPDGVI